MPSNNPMNTCSSIRHWFDVEISPEKFVEITSILKGKSTWKLWHRFDVDISTWIRLSKSTKYRWVFHVHFSMSFRRQIDVTAVLAVFPFYHFLTFSALGTYSKLFWYNADLLQFQRYWRNHWFWNYWNYTLWKYCNNADK